MFRRSDKTTASSKASTVPTLKEGGKGRPTPSRKDAQAAARGRARQPMDKKTARKALRERQSDDNRKMREGMKTGDERYLPPRDQGPVRRFVRDYVDSRLCFAELLLPLLIIVMVLTYSGQAKALALGNAIWFGMLVVTLFDTTRLVLKIKKEVRRRFPAEPTKGVGLYAVMRVLQVRPLRMPKRRVSLGEKLPERY